MTETRDPRAALRAHLQFYAELGIAGFSRDASWRANPSTPEMRPGAQLPSPGVAPDSPVDGRPVSSSGVAADLQVDGIGGAALPSTLDELRAHIGPQCTRCKLCTLGRRQVVFGVGNPQADLMFVGEAPGADEDEQGVPFVGRAGQLLTKIIEAIELRRDDVYIANVIKCRPPGNRNPEPDEVATCEPFLFRQIDLVQPKVVVALGKFAAQSLLRTDMPITRLRGQVHAFRGAQLVPTFHPAYLLRSPDKKRETWEDMKLVRSLLRGEAR
jgi:uracil-DNA glycosylase